MNKLVKIIHIFIFAAIFLTLGTVKSKAANLYLNNLDYNVQINNDGSMRVIETWDINIKSTNTLYKSFKTDTSKYSKISNVSVTDVTKGKNEHLTYTNKWAYHVTKGYYYGTENEEGDFEIGWGVGLDNSSATRQYQISYTVEDVITKYNDYAELYWQFIGEDFEISCDKITGVIYLPGYVNNKDYIKVWGHTEDLNGTINIIDTHKIQFDLENYKSGRFVEIRTLMPSELILYSNKVKNKEVLQTAINEETKWANEANQKRERQEWIKNNLAIILISIYLIINILLIVVYFRKIIKYSKKNKKLEKYQPTVELEYYRDLPDENATPGEAVKICNLNIFSYTPYNFGKVFSATMLNLALKGYIEIRQEKNQKGKEIINIIILEESKHEIKPDEKCVMEFIKKSANGKSQITLKELENYIKNHPTATEKLLKDSYENTEKQLIEEKIIDKDIYKEYEKYKNKQLGYTLAIIFMLAFTLIAFLIPIILFIVNAVMCNKIAKKLNVLTQKGIDMQEQWKALKNYMENFSLLDKREVPELVIWEKYLVFATAFGIADKVIKQLKIVYPNFEEMTNGITTYTYMNVMMNTNFSSSFSNAIISSMSSAYSSGSGSGGGFSGGGGFGRRPVVAADGR